MTFSTQSETSFFKNWFEKKKSHAEIVTARVMGYFRDVAAQFNFINSTIARLNQRAVATGTADDRPSV